MNVPRFALIVIVLFFFCMAPGCKKKDTSADNYTVTFDFSYTGVPCPGSQIHFKAAAPPGVSLHWDFGDGTSSTDSTPSHIYNSVDSFNVTLVINGNPLYTVSKKVAVFKAPLYTQNLAGNYTWRHTYNSYGSSGHDTNLTLAPTTFAINYIDVVTIAIGADTLIYDPGSSSDYYLYFSKLADRAAGTLEMEWSLQYNHYNNAITYSVATYRSDGSEAMDNYMHP